MRNVFNFIFKFTYKAFVETSLWSNLVFIIPKATPAWKISIPVPDFSSYQISSYVGASFAANDKQNCVIIAWYWIPWDEHFI